MTNLSNEQRKAVGLCVIDFHSIAIVIECRLKQVFVMNKIPDVLVDEMTLLKNHCNAADSLQDEIFTAIASTVANSN